MLLLRCLRARGAEELLLLFLFLFRAGQGEPASGSFFAIVDEGSTLAYHASPLRWGSN